ncbi:MAG TPA: hypothetical protein VFK50_09925 [Sphingomicrobium sp.]|nr:hypothetical protein [Sphingomicrobium sp.]
MKKDGLDERTGSGRGWASVESYFAALARRRTARHKREGRPGGRLPPNVPANTIGTIPFIVMMVAFALLVFAIAWLAWPAGEKPRPRPMAQELGTAPPGWMDEAEKEMSQNR